MASDRLDDELTEAQRNYLSHVSEARATLDLEALVLTRPDLADELRSFHAEYNRLERDLRALGAAEHSRSQSSRADVLAGTDTADLLDAFRAEREGSREYFRIETIARGGFAVVEKV